MFRTALRVRWLPRHLLLVVVVTGFCWLGHWQWDVSQSSRGSLQNLLYAFQWWAMALIVIYGWWRLLRDDTHPHERVRVAVSIPVEAPDDESWAPFAVAAAQAPADEPDEPDELDDELAEYNRYLARLNERAESSGSTRRLARPV